MVRRKLLTASCITTPPAGDPIPSQADMDGARPIVEVAKPLAVGLHNHIIFGRDGIPQIGRGRDGRDAGATPCLPERLRTQARCRTFRETERRRP